MPPDIRLKEKGPAATKIRVKHSKQILCVVQKILVIIGMCIRTVYEKGLVVLRQFYLQRYLVENKIIRNNLIHSRQVKVKTPVC